MNQEFLESAGEDRVDELSLYPRPVFNRDLPACTAASEQLGEPLALVMIDLDKFKSINDSHGHSYGDQILQSVAESLRQITGRKGSCYRYGGDEFSILLPNYSADEAAALAERIRRQIEASLIGSKELRVTASLGVANAPTHARTADDLLKMADAALYEAKEFRGNLVRISGEPRPSTVKPRVTTRREPDPSGLTQTEAEKIRAKHFRHLPVFCPRDGSLLKTQEFDPDDKGTPDLHISCPFCGLSDRILGPS